MAAYHQMGHDSENLLFDADLRDFGGAVFSPVNYVPTRARQQVQRVREELPGGFDLVLDPQLYVPETDRGKLRQWSYFPSDVDTADLSSLAWWKKQNANLSEAAVELGVNAICSPATLPRADAFTDPYYAYLVEVGNDLVERLGSSGSVRALQTAVVGLKELAIENRPLEVASILSNTKSNEVYLVFYSETQPRRELSASDQLSGAARLISELRRAKLKVLVGFASADMIVWKAAGANSCATGKFFNLRRFARSRFEDPMDGGQNIAYFFEEALFAFLREADLRRIRQHKLLSDATLRNPFAQRILEKLELQPGTAWVGDGWRQFLSWFVDCEARLDKGGNADALLSAAEALWLELPEKRLLMDEPRNDGSWIRPWRIAALSTKNGT